MKAAIAAALTPCPDNYTWLLFYTAQTNTALTNALTTHVTNTALTNVLAAHTDRTTLNTLLAASQNTSIAGTGISIAGATISSTHTPIILQLDGTTQTGATTLNIVGNNARFANNVLNISRMAWQDSVTLGYSNSTSDKNPSQPKANPKRTQANPKQAQSKPKQAQANPKQTHSKPKPTQSKPKPIQSKPKPPKANPS